MQQVKRSPEYFTTGHRETWSGITPVEYVVRTINRRNRWVVVYRYRTGFRRKTIR